MAAKELVGKVTHYYDKIGVAVVELSSKLKVGDNISIEGPGVSFEQMEKLKNENLKEFYKIIKRYSNYLPQQKRNDPQESNTPQNLNSYLILFPFLHRY